MVLVKSGRTALTEYNKIYKNCIPTEFKWDLKKNSSDVSSNKLVRIEESDKKMERWIKRMDGNSY